MGIEVTGIADTKGASVCQRSSWKDHQGFPKRYTSVWWQCNTSITFYVYKQTITCNKYNHILVFFSNILFTIPIITLFMITCSYIVYQYLHTCMSNWITTHRGITVKSTLTYDPVNPPLGRKRSSRLHDYILLQHNANTMVFDIITYWIELSPLHLSSIRTLM